MDPMVVETNSSGAAPMEVETNSSGAARNHEEEMKADVFKFVSYQPARDPPSDVRNALLVVAALIATITFDKGTDPPDNLKDMKTTFLVANTLGFSASMTIIEYCAAGFPFQRELRASIIGVVIAYCAGAYMHIDEAAASILLSLALNAPYLSRAVPKWIKKRC